MNLPARLAALRLQRTGSANPTSPASKDATDARVPLARAWNRYEWATGMVVPLVWVCRWRLARQCPSGYQVTNTGG